MRASRVVIGKRVQPGRNFSYGAGFGVKDLGSVDFSRRGVLLRSRGAKLRTGSLTFSNLKKDEAEQVFKPLLEYLGQHRDGRHLLRSVGRPAAAEPLLLSARSSATCR